MNKRIDIIFWSMIVLTPVTAVALAFRLWLYPEIEPFLSPVANLLVAAGTFDLALVAILQMRQLNAQQAAQEQASFRPVLIPDGFIPTEVLWNGPDFHLRLRNVGPGLASNVEAVLLPPKANRNTIPPIFYATITGPIPSGESIEIGMHVGGYMIVEDDSISGIPLLVPPERTPETGFPSPRRIEPRCVARLTITTTDLLGNKHASIFDWPITGGWLAVKLIRNATADIETLDTKNRSPIPSRPQ